MQHLAYESSFQLSKLLDKPAFILVNKSKYQNNKVMQVTGLTKR